MSFTISVAGANARGGGGENDDKCYVCYSLMCAHEECGKTPADTACCSRALCCECASKLSQACSCDPMGECENVVMICPHCRKIVPIRALDLLRARDPPCAACVAAEKAEAAETVGTGEEDGPGEAGGGAEAGGGDTGAPHHAPRSEAGGGDTDEGDGETSLQSTPSAGGAARRRRRRRGGRGG